MRSGIKSKFFVGFFRFTLAFSWTLPAAAQLRVGAARVDVTPRGDALPSAFHSVLDSIFARAILVENGKDSILLVNADVIIIQDDFYKKVVQELERATGVSQPNILLSATHDHSAPFASFQSAGPTNPKNIAFAERLDRGIVEAAMQARAALQPAEVGYANGQLYLNVNRDAIDSKTRLWSQEANPAYPSDKTLAVIEFRRPGGEPIAFYMNYAMHAITTFLRQELSGDFPGAAERYVEDAYGNKVVAMWTSGAAGDQNPYYLRQNQAIGAAAIQAEMDPSKSDDSQQTESTAALFRVMFGNTERPPAKFDPMDLERSTHMMQAMGQITGEETLIAASQIETFDSNPLLSGASKEVTCPGRRRLDHGREGAPGRYEDGDPITLNIGTVRIGEIALGWADAELYNMIGQEVKAQSPFRKTIMVSLTNGQAKSGYVPTDDAFARSTFEVASSNLKPGCAEQSIVKGVAGIMAEEIRK